MHSENQLAAIVVNICVEIHKTYGPGMFENVYETLLAYELQKIGIHIARQKTISLCHEGIIMDVAYKADLILEDKLIVEVKSVAGLEDLHYKQVITYLKITDCRLGLLINFNVPLIKNGIHRIVNKL
ncbi:GxxExxY protein [Flavihumibacter petaseus]|nr:GxxExxY protein [Flavihumibacter petaseus]